MEETNQPITPKWLSELQQRSWEPEILLSGIVLYGMFKVPDLLDEFLRFFKLNVFGNSQDIDNLVALFKMGIYWLIAGLILHLICRGIWIGMVGLSYTFPKGIRHEKLEYKGKFNDKVNQTPSFELIVMRLEKVCSSLFSISFMLFMSLIGGYLFFFCLVVFPFIVLYLNFDLGFTGTTFQIFQFYVLIIVTLASIALIDFVSLGYFRRFKAFNKVYWPIHRLVSILTLSRFYRPIYYGVVTNFNRWVFFIFLLCFTVISIFGAGSITNTTYPGDPYSKLEFWGNNRGYMAYAGYYDDQNQELASTRASIPSDIISGDVLRLFVVANITTEANINEFMPLDSLDKVYPDTASIALKLLAIQSFYQIILDGKVIKADSWLTHYKYQTKQRGYLAYIDISEVKEGLHWLEISGPESMYGFSFAEIPFYRDVTFKIPETPVQNNNNEEQKDFQPKPFGIRD